MNLDDAEDSEVGEDNDKTKVLGETVDPGKQMWV